MKNILDNAMIPKKFKGFFVEIGVKSQHSTLRKKCPHSELFWSECGKMRTRITLYTNTFHAVDILKIEFPLIDFILSFCFYTPRKQKTRVMFSGEIKNHQWYATGWRPVFKVALGHQSSPFSSGKKTVIFPQSDFT